MSSIKIPATVAEVLGYLEKSEVKAYPFHALDIPTDVLVKKMISLGYELTEDNRQDRLNPSVTFEFYCTKVYLRVVVSDLGKDLKMVLTLHRPRSKSTLMLTDRYAFIDIPALMYALKAVKSLDEVMQELI